MDLIKLREKHHQYNIAVKIVMLGGRATLIESFLGINKRSASILFKTIAQRSSSGGLLPYDTTWIIKSPINCLHSSYFYSIFNKIEIGAYENTDKKTIFLSAYTIYKDIFGKDLFPIDRAWHVYLQISCGFYKFVKCNRCDSNFLTITNYPIFYQTCPICDVEVDCTDRKRWIQKRKVA